MITHSIGNRTLTIFNIIMSGATQIIFIFFQNHSFKNVTNSVKQFGSRSGQNVLSWVQTVCKSYQQIALVGSELK